jgi:hypothetical protein
VNRPHRTTPQCYHIGPASPNDEDYRIIDVEMTRRVISTMNGSEMRCTSPFASPLHRPTSSSHRTIDVEMTRRVISTTNGNGGKG